MLALQHASSGEVRQQVDDLVQRWTDLTFAAENHSRGLEEAQDILSFNTQVEKVDAWIRDKVGVGGCLEKEWWVMGGCCGEWRVGDGWCCCGEWRVMGGVVVGSGG